MAVCLRKENLGEPADIGAFVFRRNLGRIERESGVRFSKRFEKYGTWLDIGPAFSFYTRDLMERFPHLEVTLLDRKTEYLDAQKEILENHLDRAHFVRADITEENIDLGKFDAVTMFNVGLYLVKETEKPTTYGPLFFVYNKEYFDYSPLEQAILNIDKMSSKFMLISPLLGDSHYEVVERGFFRRKEEFFLQNGFSVKSLVDCVKKPKKSLYTHWLRWDKGIETIYYRKLSFAASI